MKFNTKKRCCFCNKLTSIADFGELDVKGKMYCFEHVEIMWQRASTSQNKIKNTSEYWNFLDKYGQSPRPK